MSQLVDRLAHLAGGAEPPALDDTGARRLVERALLESRAPVAQRRSPIWPVAAFALGCGMVIAWLAFGRPPVAREPELVRLTLPTGDRLVGTAGARFELAEITPASRRVKLADGTMLFDVAHVVAGQRFEVATAHVTVVARGTVFSVTTDATTTRVHVYEGVVDVIEGSRVQALPAGGTFATGHADHDSTQIVLAAETAVVDRRAAGTQTADPAERGATADPSAGVVEPRADPGSVPTSSPSQMTSPSPSPSPSPLPSPSPSPSPVAPERGSQPTSPSLAEARAAVGAGEFATAIEIVDRERARRALAAAWYLVLSDAERGLGHAKQAADALDAAASALSGAERSEAAYSAAYLRFRQLHDGAAALQTLEAAGVTDVGSPLEERGLALRTQILVALDRDADAVASARHYLDRFPRGELAAYMHSISNR